VSDSRSLLRVRGWVYLYAALMVPLVYGASFPMARMAWIGWLGFVPWFVAVRVARTGAAVLICCVSTLLGSYLCTPWLARAVANYYQQPLALGLALFVGVWVVTISPFLIAFTLCFRELARRPSRWLPLLAAAAWAGAELGRARLLVGDPFGLFGYSQLDVTALVQIADITGVYGITLLPMAVNAALAEVWLAYAPSSRQSPGESERQVQVPTTVQAWQGLVLVAAVLAAVLTYGFVRTRAFEEAKAGPATRMAIIQGNLDLGSQWHQEFYGRNLATYMELTVQSLQKDRPPLVFWPESAMTFFLEDEPAYRAALGYMLSPLRTQLVAGGPRTAGTAPQRYFNSAFVIGSDGNILATYDKQRLLPFAEYFPFGGVELLRRQFARVREFVPGGRARILPTVAGAAGVLICNEAMFGEMAADRVRAGADYLVTLANDSWLGDRMYAEEAFDMARLRAVEQRRYLVRASTSGPSAIVDPLGRVLARTADDSQATLTGAIRPSKGLTVYARYGDAFGLLCAIVPLAVILVRRVDDRRRRAHPLVPATADRGSVDDAA